jgi:hypothetical protein
MLTSDTAVRVNVPALPPGYTACFDIAEGVVSIVDRKGVVLWDENADDILDARAQVTHVCDYGYEDTCDRPHCSNLVPHELPADLDDTRGFYCSDSCGREDTF